MDQDFIQSIQDKKLQNRDEQEQNSRHSQLLEGNNSVQESVMNMARGIMEVIAQNQPNVSVKNFPSSLATSSDIEALREVLKQSQSDTQETTENTTDELKSVLEGVLNKLGDIEGKDTQNSIVDALEALKREISDKRVDVKNLDDLGNFFFELQQSVENLDLNVNVEKPDLSEIKDGMAELKKAVKAIKIPEVPEQVPFPSEIFIGILEELQDQRLLLQKILTRPIPVGSGGAIGTGAAATETTNNISTNESTHSHTADEPAITQTHEIVANDATHSHTSDNITVDTNVAILVDDAGHAHAADEPAITQTHEIVAADATHGHTADNVTVGISVADALLIELGDFLLLETGDKILVE